MRGGRVTGRGWDGFELRIVRVSAGACLLIALGVPRHRVERVFAGVGAVPLWIHTGVQHVEEAAARRIPHHGYIVVRALLGQLADEIHAIRQAIVSEMLATKVLDASAEVFRVVRLLKSGFRQKRLGKQDPIVDDFRGAPGVPQNMLAVPRFEGAEVQFVDPRESSI